MTTIPVEFSRVASLELLTKRVDLLAMKATPAECEALAKRFHIVSIDFLKLKSVLNGVVESQLIMM